jgi:hypothetical protein
VEGKRDGSVAQAVKVFDDLSGESLLKKPLTFFVQAFDLMTQFLSPLGWAGTFIRLEFCKPKAGLASKGEHLICSERWVIERECHAIPYSKEERGLKKKS